MSDLHNEIADLLRRHNYMVVLQDDGRRPHLLFESDQCIGLLLFYADPSSLLSEWRSDSAELLDEQKLGLRRSMEKAWNSYLVLVSEGGADQLQQALLESVEEDLVGTRKIARAGIRTKETAARAMLPLLPLQSPPNLQPVDMQQEIRIRASQLPTPILDAFFAGRNASTLMQLLEEM